MELRNKAGKPVYGTSIPEVIVSREFAAVNGTKWNKGSSWDFKSLDELREWNASACAAKAVYKGERSAEIKRAVVFHNDPDIAEMNDVIPGQINPAIWKCEIVMEIGKHFYFEIYEKGERK